MILLIDEDKKVKDIIKDSKFSEMGVWERTHMEEWIADSPDILGEKLLTITTEYDGFDKTNKRLDILAVDKNGKLVVIELKRDVADTFVDLQAIHYAAYCSNLTLDDVAEIHSEYNNDSKENNLNKIIDFIESDDFIDFDDRPRMIIVANDFKEETLAAVIWLRDNEIDIKCVKLEAHQLEEEKIAITPSIIIPLPEAEQFMIFREHKSKITANREPNRYHKFWSGLLEKFVLEKPEFSNKKSPRENYLQLPIGHDSEVHFEWAIRKRPTDHLVTALHFEYPNKEKNEEILDYFRNKKNEINRKLPGEDVYFEKFGRRSMQIYIKRDNNDLNDESIDWCIKSMIKFQKALKPIVDEWFKLNK